MDPCFLSLQLPMAVLSFSQSFFCSLKAPHLFLSPADKNTNALTCANTPKAFSECDAASGAREGCKQQGVFSAAWALRGKTVCISPGPDENTAVHLITRSIVALKTTIYSPICSATHVHAHCATNREQASDGTHQLESQFSLKNICDLKRRDSSELVTVPSSGGGEGLRGGLDAFI